MIYNFQGQIFMYFTMSNFIFYHSQTHRLSNRNNETQSNHTGVLLFEKLSFIFFVPMDNYRTDVMVLTQVIFILQVRLIAKELKLVFG